MAAEKKQMAYLVYPGINLLDLVGTYSILGGLMMAGYRSFTVAENLEPMNSDTVLGFVPDKTFADAPRPNVLVVMGGGIATLKAFGNDALTGYVRSAAASAERVIGVSTGTLLLAGLGMLEGRQATTHWMYGEILERFGARYMEKRWVQDDRFMTCAGGTAGMDMGLALLAQLAGEGLARQQQLFGEYDPEPPFGGIAWDQVDRGALEPILAQHQSELQQALERHPEIYRRLFAAEAVVL